MFKMLETADVLTFLLGKWQLIYYENIWKCNFFQ